MTEFTTQIIQLLRLGMMKRDSRDFKSLNKQERNLMKNKVARGKTCNPLCTHQHLYPLLFMMVVGFKTQNWVDMQIIIPLSYSFKDLKKNRVRLIQHGPHSRTNKPQYVIRWPQVQIQLQNRDTWRIDQLPRIKALELSAAFYETSTMKVGTVS